MALDQQQYSKLAEGEFKDEDPLDDSNNPPPKPRFLSSSKRKPWIISGFSLLGLLAAVLLALGALHQSSTHPSSTSNSTSATATSALSPEKSSTAEQELETSAFDLGDQILDCGDNFHEARNKSCVYDVMMQLWIPAPCYDGALSERFLAEGNWTWWADAGATEIISDERIKLGEHEVTYVSADYHATHCMYAWELLVRGLRTRKPIIEPLISYDHAVHCRHKALKAHDSHGAIAPTRYTKCAMYDTWKYHLPENRFSSVD